MTTTAPSATLETGARRRPLVGWLVADVISITGTRVSMIAIPLFVLAATGSATRTGLVAFAELVPLIALKALCGPVIDRLGARRVAVTCDLGSTIVVGSVPILYAASRLPFVAFLALVALAGALRGPGDAAKNALAPVVAATARVPMERVTGLAGTAERTATMTGAIIAGLLVAATGPANALYVDAGSFAASAGVLLWGIAAPLSASNDSGFGSPENLDNPDNLDNPESLSYLGQLRAGWDFLRTDRLLLGIAVMVAMTNLIDQAWVSVLLPVWAIDSTRGAAALGLLLAVFGGLAALGALSAAVWAARLPRHAVYLGAFLVAGLPRFLVLAYDTPIWVALVTFGLGGFAAGFINPIIGAVEFERIPAPLVGRVSSLVTSMAWGLMPLGGLLGGLLVDVWGLQVALVSCGVGYLAVTMLPAIGPTWRELGRRPSPCAT